MRFPNSKTIGGLAAAGVVALVTTVSSPVSAQQDQTTTQILNQCNTNTSDMVQVKACLQAAGMFLKSILPGQQYNPLINVLGDQVHSIGTDPLPLDPDVSTPPAPSDPTTDDGNDQ